MKQEDIKRMGELYKSVIEGKSVEEECSKTKKEELDPVNQKELKKDFKDREDKDIDNDGEVDDQDEYLHKKRQAISKAVKESTFGQFLMDIAEETFSEAKQPGDSGSEKQPMGDGLSPNAKKVKKDAEDGKEVLDGQAIEADPNNGQSKSVKQASDRGTDNLNNGDSKTPKGVKEFFSFLDGLNETKKEEDDEDEEKESPNTVEDDEDEKKSSGNISAMIKKNNEKRQSAEDGEEEKEASRK